MPANQYNLLCFCDTSPPPSPMTHSKQRWEMARKNGWRDHRGTLIATWICLFCISAIIVAIVVYFSRYVPHRLPIDAHYNEYKERDRQMRAKMEAMDKEYEKMIEEYEAKKTRNQEMKEEREAISEQHEESVGSQEENEKAIG